MSGVGAAGAAEASSGLATLGPAAAGGCVQSLVAGFALGVAEPLAVAASELLGWPTDVPGDVCGDCVSPIRVAVPVPSVPAPPPCCPPVSTVVPAWMSAWRNGCTVNETLAMITMATITTAGRSQPMALRACQLAACRMS